MTEDNMFNVLPLSAMQESSTGEKELDIILNLIPNLSKLESSEKRIYLTTQEINLLLTESRKNNSSIRNYTLILMSFRHGLRVSEAIGMRWDDINWKEGRIYVRRAKGSLSSTHPLEKDEINALRKLKTEQAKSCKDSPYLFISNRQAVMSRKTVYRIIKELGVRAGLDFPIHPHMLRHSCGFALASKNISTIHIKEFLGHKYIENTAVYTRLAGRNFDDFGEWWK